VLALGDTRSRCDSPLLATRPPAELDAVVELSNMLAAELDARRAGAPKTRSTNDAIQSEDADASNNAGGGIAVGGAPSLG
jgi:hypothetical protein